MKNSSIIVLALCIFLGFTSLGYFINLSVNDSKSLDRTVVVKGLSERVVLANHVVWPINFTVKGNTLEEIYAKNTQSNERIIAFLTSNGIAKEEISVLMPNIDDKTLYASQDNMPLHKYMAGGNIIVNSRNVAKVSQLTSDISILMKEGINFSNNGVMVQYSFTELNDIKPTMIEDATKNAREVAERFAKDSKSFLGKIRTANQGLFSISTPDSYKPQFKRIRVVSTVEYYLVD